MKKLIYIVYCIFFVTCYSCSSSISEMEEVIEEMVVTPVKDTIVNTPTVTKPLNFKILSLGDSYTIGESVCDTCNFPKQLVDSLLKKTDNKSIFPLKIIARTGWTTTNLINAIASENISSDYSLTTLLIGVNNQYQNRPFSLYEKEFPKLVDIAIESVGGNSNKVIVVSIPDYAFTPFGDGNTAITNKLKEYDAFAKSYCTQNNITFINITDITQNGLADPSLVASDGLHPSKKAYAKFVHRIMPFAIEKLDLK